MAESRDDFEIMDFHTRILDQEPDTIQIIPTTPDYVIVGTYNLEKRLSTNGDIEEKNESSSTRRNGSLQILPFTGTSTFNDAITTTTTTSSILARKDFDCAIVDLHFHPVDRSLFGVATSTAQICLFRVVCHAKFQDTDGSKSTTTLEHDTFPDDHRHRFTIQELGIVKVLGTESDDEDDDEVNDTQTLPLITYFTWFDNISSGADGSITVTLAACDAEGNTRVIRASVPEIRETDDVSCLDSTGKSLAILKSQVRQIHHQQYDLEAWVLALIPLQPLGTETQTTLPRQSYLLLTGGDDANIIASTFNLNTSSLSENDFVSDVTQWFVMKNQHESGVVFILPLPLPTLDISSKKANVAPLSKAILILTGSYDDHLRLFLLQQANEPGGGHLTTPKLEASIDLSGGVWRAILLDSYYSQSSTVTVPQSSQELDGKQLPTREQWDWVFLVCTMYDGAKIVRLSMIYPGVGHKPSTAAAARTKSNLSSSSALSGPESIPAGSTTTTTQYPTRDMNNQEDPRCEWGFGIEATFKKGHESMVYAAVAKGITTGTIKSSTSAPSMGNVMIANDDNSCHLYDQGHERQYDSETIESRSNTTNTGKPTANLMNESPETRRNPQQQQQQKKEGLRTKSNDDDDDDEEEVKDMSAKKSKNRNNRGPRTWQILSSSFYDRKLCNWTWIDDK